MLTVVCWKWVQEGGRAKFGPEHVNTLYNMVRRHYSGAFRMVCFTDDPIGIDHYIETLPLPECFDDLTNPLGHEYPSCYRRLALFGPGMEEVLGERFVSVDLDCVIVGELNSLWDRDDDIVFWQSPVRKPDYNGSMWLAKTGACPELWDEFDPVATPELTKAANHIGSDQGWMSYRLPNRPVWTGKKDGVYAWNPQIRHRNYRLPAKARIVFFPGIDCPWFPHIAEKAGWVRDHYR